MILAALIASVVGTLIIWGVAWWFVSHRFAEYSRTARLRSYVEDQKGTRKPKGAHQIAAWVGAMGRVYRREFERLNGRDRRPAGCNRDPVKVAEQRKAARKRERIARRAARG